MGDKTVTKCPDCDGPMEYDEDAGTYYCPKCEKHREPVEVEQKKTMYQDTTENETPDPIFSDEEDEEAAEE
jgi:anaerobic ribonucleoside-triphosphate reductase